MGFADDADVAHLALLLKRLLKLVGLNRKTWEKSLYEGFDFGSVFRENPFILRNLYALSFENS